MFGQKYEIPALVMLLGSFSSAIKKWRALQGRVRCLYTARPGEAQPHSRRRTRPSAYCAWCHTACAWQLSPSHVPRQMCKPMLYAVVAVVYTVRSQCEYV